jgi:hypothetical protein
VPSILPFIRKKKANVCCGYEADFMIKRRLPATVNAARWCLKAVLLTALSLELLTFTPRFSEVPEGAQNESSRLTAYGLKPLKRLLKNGRR